MKANKQTTSKAKVMEKRINKGASASEKTKGHGENTRAKISKEPCDIFCCDSDEESTAYFSKRRRNRRMQRRRSAARNKVLEVDGVLCKGDKKDDIQHKSKKEPRQKVFRSKKTIGKVDQDMYNSHTEAASTTQRRVHKITEPPTPNFSPIQPSLLSFSETKNSPSYDTSDDDDDGLWFYESKSQLAYLSRDVQISVAKKDVITKKHASDGPQLA